MLKIYLKIAIRNLWRSKGFSAINICGFAVGIATCLLILLFLQNQFSYDRYNEKANRIVRVVFHANTGNQETKEASVMPPVAQAFKTDFPEVQEATRIRPYGTPRITYGDKTFKEGTFAFVDSNFFQVFTLPLIEGSAATALLQPNTVVISKAVAKKYFGDADPIGKTLEFKDNNTSLTVTGVIDQVPFNSHFHFDLFASMSSLPESKESTWMSSNFYAYLVLPKGYDYKKLEAKLAPEIDKYIGPQMQKGMGMTLSQFRQNGNRIGFALQPLTDIHLHSDLTGDMEPHGDIRYVYIFSAVAVFMLLIACINFMNLSTAGASKRAKEVGIRKVMGSVRGQLVRQFLLESFLLTAIALVLALALVRWALPFFDGLAGENLNLQLAGNPWVAPALIGFGLFVALLAGSYPAFYLSSFNPVSVLKGRLFSGKGRSGGLRSGLVIFQFFISISLMIGTIVVYRQLSYIQHKKLGYDKDQVLILQDTYQLGKNQDAFRQELLADPRVVSVSQSDYLPAVSINSSLFYAYPDNRTTFLVKTQLFNIEEHYIPTLGMEIAEGRNFSSAFGSDSSSIIINETAAREYGWGRNALGHRISQDGEGNKHIYTVIGVVKDFHFQSLHERITPLAMTLSAYQGTMIAKVKTADIAGLLTTIQKEWKQLGPDAPFSYSFLDERFFATYKAEQNIGRILGIFAGLTILVACLGLFGLATFTAEQRTKEIGIRKVLGASVIGIVSLLSKDFLRLVLLAFVIATPVAWYVMNRWLQDFAYRAPINGWVFALTAALAIGLAILTIGFRAFRAATANPVRSLRAE